MKQLTKVIIILAVLIVSLALLSFNISGFIFNNSSADYEYTNSWTKAICNETSCQDYIIYCNENEFVKQIPISGAVISISKDWEDPRDIEMRERVC